MEPMRTKNTFEVLSKGTYNTAWQSKSLFVCWKIGLQTEIQNQHFDGAIQQLYVLSQRANMLDIRYYWLAEVVSFNQMQKDLLDTVCLQGAIKLEQWQHTAKKGGRQKLVQLPNLNIIGHVWVQSYPFFQTLI